MPSISTPSLEGDVKLSWNPDNADEVKNAKDHFDKLKASGHIFFRLKDGAKASRMKDFDAKAGELTCEFDPKADIVATPIPRGG